MRFELVILFLGALLFSTSFLSAQEPISGMDKLNENSNATIKTNNKGVRFYNLDTSVDIYSVFSNPTFVSTLKHPVYSSFILPIPFQVDENGRYIDYSDGEWSSIRDRIMGSKNTYSREQFMDQFFKVRGDFLGLNQTESSQSLMFADWFSCYLSTTEFAVISMFKFQNSLGNVCIMDEGLDVPSSKNITRSLIPQDSPNAMLAYMSLFNRWLFARPNRANEIMKAKQVGPEFFSDAMALCQAFAPELIPIKEIKKGKS